MAFSVAFRRATAAAAPLAARTTKAKPAFLCTMLLRNILPLQKCPSTLSHFSPLSTKQQQSSDGDLDLVGVLDSEIKFASDDYKKAEKLPKGFPFEIGDAKGTSVIVLRRMYGREEIEVLVSIPSLVAGDEAAAEDDENYDEFEDKKTNEEDGDGQFCIPLTVNVSKGGGGPSLELGCTGYPDEIEIDAVSLKSDGDCEGVSYEGPRFKGRRRMNIRGEPEHGPMYFELNTGAKIPSIGLGTWMAEPGLVSDAVIAAVKAGYRHIDCAKVYGNEAEIGVALKQLFTNEVVKRSELWVTSKLWCSDHAPEDVAKGLTKTLEDLQLDYIDLYLIHWPIRTKPGSNRFERGSMLPLCMSETWNAMEGLYASGQARAIGVSNFSTKKLQDLLKYARVPPAVNQVECHPVWQQSGLHNFCKSTGIHLSAYSPLGSPGSWVKGEILKEPILIEIAEKLNKSPAQVALRWGIQSGHSILPKSMHGARIKENLDIFDWSIPLDLYAKFTEIHQARLLRGEFAVNETESPYKTVEELWDGEI